MDSPLPDVVPDLLQLSQLLLNLLLSEGSGRQLGEALLEVGQPRHEGFLCLVEFAAVFLLDEISRYEY